MSETLRAALIFLVNSLFDIYLFVLMVRLLLAWVSADYHNPLTQFVIKCTQLIVKPLRHYLPNVRDLETSTLVLIFVFEIIKFSLVSLLSFGFPHIVGLILLAIADMLKLLLQTFTYAILLEVVVGWLQPASPIFHVLVQLTSPILKPLRRLIPIVHGFDITPIPALIILQLLVIVAVNPLLYLALSIAVG